MSLFQWVNGATGGTPMSAENLNKAQQQILDTIYPIGSIYKSNNNINPSEFLGGTWESIKCSELVDGGTDENGVNYRVYSDGYCECWGSNYVESVVPYTAYDEQITLPFSYSGKFYIVSSRQSGGSFFAETDYFYEMSSQNAIHFAVYNNNAGSNAEGMHFAWKTYGYIGKSTMFAWKRISL